MVFEDLRIRSFTERGKHEDLSIRDLLIPGGGLDYRNIDRIASLSVSPLRDRMGNNHPIFYPCSYPCSFPISQAPIASQDFPPIISDPLMHFDHHNFIELVVSVLLPYFSCRSWSTVSLL